MRLYTYEYDQTYTPAMPVASVQLTSLVTGRTAGPFSAVIDSGSDGTLIPIDILDEIGALSIGSGRLRWLWQESRTTKIYVVRLALGPYQLAGVRVASVPGGTEFILGRNVLNQISLTLNGPAESIEIPHP
jgi:predicted aspartyl protease